MKFMNKYHLYLKLAEAFKYAPTNHFLNIGLFLTSGWVSIFMGFFISRDVGLAILKLSFKDLVIKIFFKNLVPTHALPLFKFLRLQRSNFLHRSQRLN